MIFSKKEKIIGDDISIISKIPRFGKKLNCSIKIVIDAENNRIIRKVFNEYAVFLNITSWKISLGAIDKKNPQNKDVKKQLTFGKKEKLFETRLVVPFCLKFMKRELSFIIDSSKSKHSTFILESNMIIEIHDDEKKVESFMKILRSMNIDKN